MPGSRCAPEGLHALQLAALIPGGVPNSNSSSLIHPVPICSTNVAPFYFDATSIEQIHIENFRGRVTVSGAGPHNIDYDHNMDYNPTRWP